MAVVSPPLLSADFLHLADKITVTNESQYDWLHIDAMDGVFIPNLSFDFPVIEAIRPICQKPLNAHPMIVEPWKFIDQFTKLGIHIMNVHYEVCPHLHCTLRAIREAGMHPAVTPNPHIPVEPLTDILYGAGMALLMSVNPGYNGQKFIKHSVRKVERLRKMIQEQGLSTLIQVDGGVNFEAGCQLVEAGADSLMADNAILKALSPQEMIAQLYAL